MNYKHDVVLRLIKMLNVVLILIPFLVCWNLSYSRNLWVSPFYAKGNYVVAFLFLVLYYMLGRTYDAFLVSHNPISEMVYSQSLAAFFSDGIMWFVICLLSRKLVSLWPLCACFVGQIVLSFIWSKLSSAWYFHTFHPKRTVIIYDTREGMENLISKYGYEKKFEVIGSTSVQECIEEELSIIDDTVDTVFLCGVHSHDRNVILKKCIAEDIDVYLLPRIGDVIMSGAKPMHMFHLPVLKVNRYSPLFEYLFLKRFFDIVLSLIAIVILSPFMIVTALAIKSDGGPALYKQVRLTKDRKEFNVLKFRSMRIDAEKDGVARLSSGDDDPRITKVGKIIRKIRFDELPQLFNILLGDMSIVGPRPERPEIAEQYEKEMPEFALRLQAKAGLTGYAQVYGKYNTTPYDKLQMDLMYIAHPSLIEDLRICFATVKILFMSDSTEGVAAGQTTAMLNVNEVKAQIDKGE